MKKYEFLTSEENIKSDAQLYVGVSPNVLNIQAQNASQNLKWYSITHQYENAVLHGNTLKILSPELPEDINAMYYYQNFLSDLDAKKVQSILDIGIGAGFEFPFLLNLFQPKQICGTTLTQAEKFWFDNYQKDLSKLVKIKVGALEILNEIDQKFDLILSIRSLSSAETYNTKDVLAYAFEQYNRLLSRGGILVLEVFTKNFEKVLAQIHPSFTENKNFYNPDEIKSQVEHFGYNVLKTGEYNISQLQSRYHNKNVQSNKNTHISLMLVKK